MKKYLSLLILASIIILIAFAFRTTGEKFGPHLTYVLDNTNKSNFYVYIYLKDKGPNVQQMLSNPLNLVTQKSLDRRAKVRPANDLVDINDVPLYDPYVRELSSKTLNLRQQIKFLNAVSAEVTREQLADISNTDFVNQVELIETYVKQKDDVEKPRQVSTENDNKINNSRYNIEADSLNYGPSGTTQITQMNVNLVHDQAILGQGILIASLDDGFRNQTHPCIY